jgi:CHAP domain
MPGRHRNSSSPTITPRHLTFGVIAGVALTVTIAATQAHIHTGHGKRRIEPAAANLTELPSKKIAPQQATASQRAVAPQRAPVAGKITGKHAGKHTGKSNDEQLNKRAHGQAASAHKAAAPVASAQDVINLAKNQVGIHENGNGGGTKFQQWYVTSPAARLTVRRDGGSVTDYGNAPWCDIFVSWLGHQADVQSMGQDAYTVDHAKWFQKTGRWGTTAKPGAIAFFSWNGGGIDGIEHIGLVVKDHHDGTIQTIEGNTSNAVKIRERSVKSVVGYGYPQYSR